ncbi:tail assembly chaperone [Arthrobacter phage LittleTokyo]|nr:tail assembly chaperone [Arthrobacter phage LittleTokyo]
MVYEVPASKASIKQNQFEFKVPGERKTRSLPLPKYLPIGWRSKMEEAGKPVQAAIDAGKDPSVEDLRLLGSLQIEILNKYSPGLVDVMDEEQLSELLKAWQEAGGITVGESVASANS